MKIITRIIAGAVAAVSLLLLISCAGDGKKYEGLITIQPSYHGDAVTTTDHEFSKDDFTVVAIYENNISRVIDDYTFEVTGMTMGLYIIDFYYGDADNEIYVPIEQNFYPTDRETFEG